MILDIIGYSLLALHFSSPIWVGKFMDYIETNKTHIEVKKHD
jgi:hypothetical protein